MERFKKNSEKSGLFFKTPPNLISYFGFHLDLSEFCDSLVFLPKLSLVFF